MVVNRIQLAEVTECHKNNMTRVFYKSLLVSIALFLLGTFYFYIANVKVTGDVINLFFLSLVAFCVYSIYLLITKLSSIKLTFYLVWAVGLFTTDVYVKDVQLVYKNNPLVFKIKVEHPVVKSEEKSSKKDTFWIA